MRGSVGVWVIGVPPRDQSNVARRRYTTAECRRGDLLLDQTGSGIIGSPITYELDGTQYLAVPSGGIGGDMSFYYTEPKAGNLFVFALDGGGPARVPPGTNLTTLPGSLPAVGEPGHTLGGRVLPGYGFEPTEGGEPIPGSSPPQPTSVSRTETNPFLGDAEAIARGERSYRARCVGCHKSSGGSGPNLFGTSQDSARFFDAVAEGTQGTTMPAFGSLLTPEEILEIHAFVMSLDRLP